MRHAIHRSAAVALLCLFAAACGNDADTGERGAPTERDGVGEC